ncbi:MAG: chorismate mutase [Verrucomicrobia bacterium]|nr:chorismate mutase [Verrucomicrobiota bacterium]
MSAPDLQPLRRAIDGLDDALTGLLVCRVCLSHQAQALKVQAGLPTLDPGGKPRSKDGTNDGGAVPLSSPARSS